MPALAFYLDAPMQSWGASSKYQYRETSPFPTKSAIVGLLAAALGIDKHSPDEAEKLIPLTSLTLTVARLPKSANGRELNSTRLTDFHTVGGGYPDTPFGKLNVPPVAEKNKSGTLKWKSPEKRTVPTWRSYLTGTSFVAILEGDGETLNQLSKALRNPVWGIWFGRKTCLPSTPLTPTLAETREQAFATLLDALPQRETASLDAFEYQQEVTGAPEDGDFFQSDQPVAFGQHQGAVPSPYRSRAIRHHRPESS
ncbi:MAG: type I-E CRISPR-associated protein Cas5/CasD [Akkermansiaceae bacterium]|nr:type I-E CRISPR-associated protein Cas5/CasD [Akkermansiaceae bacterium]